MYIHNHYETFSPDGTVEVAYNGRVIGNLTPGGNDIWLLVNEIVNETRMGEID